MAADRQNRDAGTAALYRWPRKNSKRFATLAMLVAGFKVSHLDVWGKANTYRGAAVVLALKEAGFPIVSELRPYRTTDGAATRIAYYSIPDMHRASVLADAARKGLQL